MGYEVARFTEGSVDEELICPICSGVLEEALQAPDCEHTFCGPCITEWLARQPTCPVDRAHVGHSHLRPAPRIVRNLLARLDIACAHQVDGCTAHVKLDQIEAHERECPHNPKRLVLCSQGCGLTLTHADLADHSCIKELRAVAAAAKKHSDELAADVRELSGELSRAQQLIAEQGRRIDWLVKVVTRGGRHSDSGNSSAVAGSDVGPPPPAPVEERERDEVARWAASLPTARVTRWGGMISTPDTVLQAVIRRGLNESGCPARVAAQLMENAHERRWPAGLNTLETRQMSRREYENYTVRRVPNRQAIVMLTCENQHMSNIFLREPGVVMIFAHGVE